MSDWQDFSDSYVLEDVHRLVILFFGHLRLPPFSLPSHFDSKWFKFSHVLMLPNFQPPLKSNFCCFLWHNRNANFWVIDVNIHQILEPLIDKWPRVALLGLLGCLRMSDAIFNDLVFNIPYMQHFPPDTFWPPPSPFLYMGELYMSDNFDAVTCNDCSGL